MSILWLVLAGTVVGAWVLHASVRALGSNPELVRELFKEQPVTMIAASAAVGSVLVWAALELLRLW